MNNNKWSLIIEVCEEQFDEIGTPTNEICVDSYFCFENLIDAVKFIELYGEASYLKNKYLLQEI